MYHNLFTLQNQIVVQTKSSNPHLDLVGLTGTIDMPSNTTTTTSPTEEAELDLATNTSTNTSTANAPFKKNDVFSSHEHFKQAVEDYCVSERMFPKLKTCGNKRKKADDYISYRYTCPRSGNHTSQKKEGIKGARPTHDSLKTGCEWHINAARERMPNDACRNDEKVRITSVSLEHTNGCSGGDDQEMIFALQKRAGRTYPEYALTHLRKEVKARRYGTDDVKSWLIQSGFLDATLEEATNLRYRLLTDDPIKDWKPNECFKEEMGQWTDYLHNEDLAKEISAGSKDSIDNLLMLHRGLKEEVDGYDSRVTTDSENRFSGTAWQTGRMRARLLRHGAMIFIDDTRSGVNTSNFCFWNVMVSDHEGKSQTVMGAMTMCASYEAVSWVLQSLVGMSPFAAEVVKATMSDLGVGVGPIQRFLPSVTFFGACTWHIMTLDFPRNLKHIPGYADCMSFVYLYLVKNTTCKQEWNVRLNEACRKWPGAAEYLQQLALSKERWGNPWRIENFTLDMEASSVVEGSFSAFHRHLGGQVHSFTGVVQQHLQKDNDKTSEERKQRVKASVAVYDNAVQGMRTKAAQECSKKCSVKVVDNFIKTNLEAQEYSYEEMTVLSAEV